MPWRQLGTVTPELLTWKTVGQPALGDVFRVRQSWVGDWPGTGFIHLSAIYSNGGRYGFEKIWPDPEARIFLMKPPEALLEAGLVIRYFAARFGSRARPYSAANWQISIDEFTPIVGPDDQPLQPVDGGTYDGI